MINPKGFFFRLCTQWPTLEAFYKIGEEKGELKMKSMNRNLFFLYIFQKLSQCRSLDPI